MARTLLFVVALLTAIVGAGVGAIAQNANPAAAGAAASPAASPAASSANLATRHAGKGVACKSCHETRKPEPVAATKCVTCHDAKALAQKTASVKPANPHDSRHFGTEADCNACHHQHAKSESLCADCHPRFNFKVP